MTQEQMRDTLDIQKMVGQLSKLEGNPAEQRNFMTRDVQIRIYSGDEQILEIRGIANVEKSLQPFFSGIKRLHYLNGQHVVDFMTKDKAVGVLFCRAVHVTVEDGRDMVTDHSIYYEDIYEKKNDRWLIKARDAHYLVSDKHPLGN